MTSEPVTAVIVIERTSGLTIGLSEMCEYLDILLTHFTYQKYVKCVSSQMK